MAKAFMIVEVDFDASITDAESVSYALDALVDTATSAPGILEKHGNPDIGDFLPIDPEDIQHLHEVAKGPITQRQKDGLANLLHRLGVIPIPEL